MSQDARSFAAPLTASRPTGERWKVLAWLCSAAAITYIGRIGIIQVQENIEFDLRLVPRLMGYVISAFALSYAMFELPSGWFADRLGPRKVLTRVVVCWMIFTALTGAAWSFASLVVFRFLIGAGEAGAFPNIARASREWFPFRERGRAQGLVWMFARFGGAVAPLIMMALAYPFGWRWAFAISGALGIVWVAVFWMRFRDTPFEDPKVNDAERALIAEGKRELTKPAPLSWPTLLSSRSMWFLALMYFCSNAGWSFFASWITPYLEHDLHLTGAKLALASGAPLFFGGIACYLGGFLTDRLIRTWGRRWGRTLLSAIGYAVGALMMLVSFKATLSHAGVAFAALCFSSFAKDIGLAASWAIAIDIGHLYSGTVSGLMNSLGNLGQVITVPIVAHLATWAGTTGHPSWEISLYYYAAMFLICAISFLFVDPRRVIVYSGEKSYPQ